MEGVHAETDEYHQLEYGTAVGAGAEVRLTVERSTERCRLSAVRCQRLLPTADN